MKYYYAHLDLYREKYQLKKEEKAAWYIVYRYYYQEKHVLHSTVKRHLPAVQAYLAQWQCYDLSAELTEYANQPDEPRKYKPRIKTGPVVA